MVSVKAGISSTIAVVGLIVALLIGVGVGVAISPIVAPSPRIPELEARIALLKGQILSGELKIGSLMPITGDLATFGQNDREGVRIAVAEVNAFFKANGVNASIKLYEEDSATDPSTALLKLQSLAAKGVKFVVGPMASSEVRQLSSYANTNKIIIISPSSTAPDLGVSGDFIFRFCPNDTIQGPAIARAMFNRGVRYSVPIFRNDPWGQGLNTTIAAAFKKLGGSTIPGIAYSPTEGATDFTVEANTLATKIQGLVNTYGADKVGVACIAFEEVVPLFLKAREHSVLWQVPWFGSDGTALSSKLVTDALAAGFSSNKTVNFLNPVFAASRSEKFAMLRSKIIAKLGREPETYAYAAYDAVWVITYALLTVNKYDSDAVRKILPSITNDYFGASGRVLLNAAGDRASADYDIWIVYKKADGTYDWKQYGVYNFGSDSITTM